MPSLLLIGSEQESRTDSISRLNQAFSLQGWDVAIVEHHAVYQDSGDLMCQTQERQGQHVAQFDWIWMLGFGERHTFLDRMQLLHHADASKFVNSPHAFLHFQNKAALAMTSLGTHAPPALVSDRIELLFNRIHTGGDWIAKPTAGSFGRDVFELNVATPNLLQILEHLTRDGYVLLQEHVTTEHEKRWFMTRGQLIGVYAKIKQGLRGNIAAEATACLCEPTSQEIDLAQAIATKLVGEGIQGCAVDIAYPYLLDVNFVNPGWFETMENLTGRNFADDLPPLFKLG